MQVQLLAATGDLVRETTIPQLQTPPDVLMWDRRVFVLTGRRGDVAQYREGEVWVLPLQDSSRRVHPAA